MNILYLILFFYISCFILVNFVLILLVYVAQWASQVELVAKSLLANAGDIVRWVCSLGREDPLKEGMTILSSILAWRIPWTEEPESLQSTQVHRVEVAAHMYTHNAQ